MTVSIKLDLRRAPFNDVCDKGRLGVAAVRKVLGRDVEVTAENARKAAALLPTHIYGVWGPLGDILAGLGYNEKTIRDYGRFCLRAAARRCGAEKSWTRYYEKCLLEFVRLVNCED